MKKPIEGRARVVIEAVEPEIDGGHFPAKRVMGSRQVVEADIFADGHDRVAARLIYRRAKERKFREVEMTATANDRWRGEFEVDEPGNWVFTVEGWVDHFLTWQYDFGKRVAAAQVSEFPLQLQIGAALVTEAASRARTTDARELRGVAKMLAAEGAGDDAVALALSPRLTALMQTYPDRRFATRYEKELPLWVDRPRARFSAWYEMFPRSTGSDGAHGTFKTAEGVLGYIASMGFDILYMPPISPIGSQFRKGKNNSVTAQPEDSGSPWAIGAPEGGHEAIHPSLGTIADFRAFQDSAAKQNMELALDIAFQCSPDHPWVTEHPSFFKHRPDGTIQYAENPPKKYQDIYPIDFESTEWRTLWDCLLGVFEYWISQGVKVFRVDNPHTKAFPFWEWCITTIHESNPEVLFLAEAFTRPKVMYRLAKLGYSQSYTYYTWRNDGPGLQQYLTELTTTAPKYFFRPNLWPNTPDILHAQLQTVGPDEPRAVIHAAYESRLVLAATLSSSYGIYGPAFELQESLPARPGSEEYLDSEKYQVRSWTGDKARDRADSLRPLIAHVNRIRQAHLALHDNETLVFHETGNPQFLCYSKTYTQPGELLPAERILVIVNLDPRGYQAGFTRLNMPALGLDWTTAFQAEDLLTGVYDLSNSPANEPVPDPHVAPAVYTWRDQSNFVSLPPGRAHILRLTQV